MARQVTSLPAVAAARPARVVAGFALGGVVSRRRPGQGAARRAGARRRRDLLERPGARRDCDGRACGAPAAAPLAVADGASASWRSCSLRASARAARAARYVRMRVEPYRTDKASAEAVVRMFEVFHKRLLRRWWRRLLLGQPAVALEVHHRVEARARDGCGQRRHGWRCAARSAVSGCSRRRCAAPTRTAA